ncbi:MAG TPA: alpha/beta fold hydrolase, partial [Actinomycetes bacterium]|nr:alpha/beta fold hydrolase [Actinomycetes bacterium]
MWRAGGWGRGKPGGFWAPVAPAWPRWPAPAARRTPAPYGSLPRRTEYAPSAGSAAHFRAWVTSAADAPPEGRSGRRLPRGGGGGRGWAAGAARPRLHCRLERGGGRHGPAGRARWHAVAPDLRGHGRSDHPTVAGAYSFEILASDLLGLADAVGWDRFALVGHSMGGAVAQLIALDRPERLTGLVLASTFHGPVPGITMELVELGRWVVRQAGMSGLADALAARRDENPASTAAFERMQEARPGYADESRARLESTSPDMWTTLAPRFVDQPDRLDRLAELQVPTAVVVGELDSTMYDDCVRLAQTIPGARLTVIPAAGHVPQVEQPDAWEAA